MLNNKELEKVTDYVEENIIDKASLAEAIGILVEICRKKEQHLIENWQDHDLAEVWREYGDRIEMILIKGVTI